MEYNYRTPEEHRAAGTAYYVEGDQPLELPGQSHFLRDGERIFHTYSTFGRGGEMTGGSYYFLDLSALGRQEEWEEPKGRAADAARAPCPTSRPEPSGRQAPIVSASSAHQREDQQRGDDPQGVVAPLARAGAAALGERLGAEQLLDDRLLEAEPALAAHREQLLGPAQVEDLGAVGGGQAIDQERVAPREPHERVRAARARRGSPPRGPRRRRRPPRCRAGRSGF